MDGYIERQTLQDIADAIREKNGSSDTYKPSEMADAIREIEGGGEGFDLTEFGISQNESEIWNDYYKKGVEYAKEIQKNFNENNIKDYLFSDSRLIFFPKINTSNVKRMFAWFISCKNLELVSEIDTSNVEIFTSAFKGCSKLKKAHFDLSKCTTLNDAFQNCTSLKSVYVKLSSAKTASAVFQSNRKMEDVIIEDISNLTNFNNSLLYCEGIVNLEITNWKQCNISIAQSSLLTPQSIHNILQNAMSVADGAIARTLTLHATAKANWQNSEYYEQDLAVLTDKGITIA